MNEAVGQGTLSHQESEWTLYVWIVMRRWTIVAVAVLTAVVVALAYLRLTPPTYEASSLVRLRKTVPIQIFGMDQMPPAQQESLDLKTATQLVTTYLTAKEALTLLQKASLQDRVSRTTREYLRLLSPQEILKFTSTTPIEPDLVRITVRHPLPEVAAALANGLAEAFVQRLNRETRAEASNERRFIESQLRLIERQLRQLDVALASAYRQLKTVDVSAETKALIDAVRTYLTDLVTTESELRLLNANLTKVREMAARQGPILSAEVLKEDPAVAELRRQLAALEIERATLTARYTPEHPAVKEVNDRISTLRGAINQRLKEAVKGIEAVPNPAYAAWQQHLMDIETRRLAAEARRQALLTLLQQARKQMERLPEDRRRIGELDRRLRVLEQAYTNLLGRLQDAQIREASRLGNALVADVATVPHHPVSPNPSRVTLFALVLGLILGVSGALLLELSQSPVTTTEEIRHLLGASVLGLIPKTRPELTRERVVDLMQSRRRTAEAIRILRSNLKFLSQKRPFKVLAVTSPTAGDGKTFLTAALGLAYAQDGYRVILVDADLRHPTLHQRLNLTNGVGLSEVLSGTVPLDEALQAGPVPNLWLLPSGVPPSSPAELLDTPAMQRLLNTLKERADLILIDTPPLLAVTDTVVLAPFVDGLLIIVTSQSPRFMLVKVREQLELVEARLLGAVLNRITSRSLRGYYYYGYGYYYYSEPE